MSPPRYQELPGSRIPIVELPGGGGKLRVIAGEAFGEKGPAETVTPINLFDLTLEARGQAELELPEDTTTLLLVLSGSVRMNGEDEAGPGELARFEREGDRIVLESTEGAKALVLNGEPIDEPVVAHGPFVMNSREEIAHAFEDFQSGRMGRLLG